MYNQSFLPVVSLLTMALGLTSCVSQPEYMVARTGDVSAKIIVVDDEGKPIPFAEVWRLADPYLGTTLKASEVSQSYFSRLVTRYKDVAEFVRGDQSWALPGTIVGPLRVLDLADEHGHTNEVIKVSGLSKREYTVEVTYAALAYGYFPKTQTVHVDPTTSNLQIRLPLRRDQHIDNSSPLLRQANAIRFEALISSPGLVTLQEIAQRNQRREELRTKLFSLSEQALADGHNSVAARLLCLIPQIPSNAILSQEKEALQLSGYTRETEKSSRNLDILRRAIQVDPGNRYALMKLHLLAPPVNRTQRIQQTEILLGGPYEAFWPYLFMRHERDLHIAGNTDRSRKFFDWFLQFEPEHYDNQGMFLKRKRIRHLSLVEFQNSIVKKQPNAEDEFRVLPVTYAAQAGRRDLVEWLLNHGVITPLPRYFLNSAFISDDPSFVEYVLSLDRGLTGIPSAWIEDMVNTLKRSGEKPELLEALLRFRSASK